MRLVKALVLVLSLGKAGIHPPGYRKVLAVSPTDQKGSI